MRRCRGNGEDGQRLGPRSPSGTSQTALRGGSIRVMGMHSCRCDHPAMSRIMRETDCAPTGQKPASKRLPPRPIRCREGQSVIYYSLPSMHESSRGGNLFRMRPTILHLLARLSHSLAGAGALAGLDDRGLLARFAEAPAEAAFAALLER